MEINKGRTDTFRFLPGTSPLCSKGQGYYLNNSTILLLFLKENRPFKDKLVIQFIDAKTSRPKEFLETNYLTAKALKTPKGFAFSSFREIYNPDIGRITIEKGSFIYQEKDFPIWIHYSQKGFEVDPDLTYERFPFKKVFTKKEDFFQAAGWSTNEKKFTRQILFHATNHELKKSCILLLSEAHKPSEADPWKCQTI
jgi:hypothetical protein